MTMRRWHLALSIVVAAAACTRELSLAGRGCPCLDGWICCSLDPKTQVCARSSDGCPPHTGDVNQCSAQGNGPAAPNPAGPGDGPSDDPARVVTPVACDDGAAPLGHLPYTPGYTPDPSVVDWAQRTASQMSLEDRAAQMRGLPSFLYSDLQRSADTATIRGFRYRDGPRGMNLGEDLEGKFPHAGTANGSSVGYSTAFPVGIARAATFDVDLEYAVGEAIGDEMQAANQTVLLAPFLNLLWHPRWGRAQETYGEDPFAAGRLGTAMAVGAQQHVLAAAKHFAAYGVEQNRDAADSSLDEQTLREIYGRPFRMVIQDGGVGAVMASVNKVNGIKAALNAHLLTDVLRGDFGFRGFVLSDFWPFWNSRATIDAQTLRNTAITAVAAGLDVELPWAWSFGGLESLATSSDGLTRDNLASAAARVLEQKARFNAQNLTALDFTGCVGLGAPKTHYSLDTSVITGDAEHAALAERAALESAVLLKNDPPALPIGVRAGGKVVVLGANVTYTVTDNIARPSTTLLNFATDVLTGDMGASRVFPRPENRVSPFAGIKAAAPGGVTVVAGTSAAEAQDADFVVVVAGLTPEDEGQEYTGGSDRVALGLDAKQVNPARLNLQNGLIAEVVALGKPMVVVLEGGSVIDMPWIESVPAVVMAWYPGQAGGAALGKLLWGRVGDQAFNFSGKLPLTWGRQLADYPPFPAGGDVATLEYEMGYRSFDRRGVPPLYPFGHGLSYTTFEYRNLQVGCSSLGKGAVLPVVVNVANTGAVAGDETVLVFVAFPHTSARRPVKELKGFARVHLEAGQEKQITIPVRVSDLDYFQMTGPMTTTGSWVVESGDVRIMVGGSSTNLPLSTSVTVAGYVTPAQ